MISPADLSNAYYRFKQTSVSLPTCILSKPIPAVLSAMDADLPTYAAMYSNLSQPPSLADSTTSLSSDDSDDTSISTLEEENNAMMKFYHPPPKAAHCRNRKTTSYEDVLLNELNTSHPFLRNNKN